MPYSVSEYSLILLNGQKIIFPRDANMETASICYGIDVKNGTLLPLNINSDGSLQVSARLNVGDVSIGSVEIKDSNTDTRARVLEDGSPLPVSTTGFVILGREGNNVRSFRLREFNSTYLLETSTYLSDVNGNILNPATKEQIEQLLLKVTDGVNINWVNQNFTPVQTTISRDAKGLVNYIDVTDNILNKRISFTRDSEDRVVSIGEVLL